MPMNPGGSPGVRLKTAKLGATEGPAQLCAMAAWPWPFAAIELIQKPAGPEITESNTVPDCVSDGDVVRLSS